MPESILDIAEHETQRAAVKTDGNKFATGAGAILVVVVVAGLLVLVLYPFRGAVAQSLDVWPRAAWMAAHFHDDAAFPPKANLCAAPFCRSTETRRVYAGGNPGHRSESKLRFCSAHSPRLPALRSRFDDALRFIYWVIAMGLSLVMAQAVPFLIIGLLMLAERRIERNPGTSSDVLRKIGKVLMTVTALIVFVVMVAWLAAWVMFAYW